MYPIFNIMSSAMTETAATDPTLIKVATMTGPRKAGISRCSWECWISIHQKRVQMTDMCLLGWHIADMPCDMMPT
jgi:hypothetical protein